MSPSAFRVWLVGGKIVCVRIVVSMEIHTMQNLDLEGKKLINIYLHDYGSFVRQGDDTLIQLKSIFCEQSSE